MQVAAERCWEVHQWDMRRIRRKFIKVVAIGSSRHAPFHRSGRSFIELSRDANCSGKPFCGPCIAAGGAAVAKAPLDCGCAGFGGCDGFSCRDGFGGSGCTAAVHSSDVARPSTAFRLGSDGSAPFVATASAPAAYT